MQIAQTVRTTGLPLLLSLHPKALFSYEHTVFRYPLHYIYRVLFPFYRWRADLFQVLGLRLEPLCNLPSSTAPRQGLLDRELVVGHQVHYGTSWKLPRGSNT